DEQRPHGRSRPELSLCYHLGLGSSYTRLAWWYREARQRVTGPILKLGIDFRGGSARFRSERPRPVSRGFCFDPVRRVGSTCFEDSPSRSRGAVAQLGERCNRTAEVRG